MVNKVGVKDPDVFVVGCEEVVQEPVHWCIFKLNSDVCHQVWHHTGMQSQPLGRAQDCILHRLGVSSFSTKHVDDICCLACLCSGCDERLQVCDQSRSQDNIIFKKNNVLSCWHSLQCCFQRKSGVQTFLATPPEPVCLI